MGSTGNTTKIAAAAVGGYVLGRKKKLKVAIGLGLYFAAKKLELNPRTMVKELSELPAVTELKEQARGQISTIGKDTAGSMMSTWAGGLADSLNERTERLRSQSAGSEEASGPENDTGTDAATRTQESRSGQGKASAPRSGSRATSKSAGSRAKGTNKGAATSRSTSRSRGPRKNSGQEGGQHG